MTNHYEQSEPQLLADSPVDTASSELVHTFLRLMQIAVYRRNTILQALGVAVCLGAAYYALATRYYDSTAKLLIIERNNDQLATVGDQPSMDNTMATHRELVVSPIVVQAAIEHLLPEHRVDFQNRPSWEWTNVLSRRLSAKTTRKTNFVEVSCRSVSPEAASAVVSAVIQSYLDFIDRTHQGSATEVIETLTGERDRIVRDLAVKQNELQAFRQRVGQLAVDSEDGVSEPIIQRAILLNDALMHTQQQRLKQQATLATVRAAIEKGEDLQQHLLGLEEAVGQQMLISALGLSPQDLTLVKDQEQKLLDAQAELRNVAPFYGSSHPKIAELRERVATLESYLASYRSGTPQRLAAFGGADLGPMLERMLAQSVAQTVEQERQLLASFEEARAEAARQSGDLVQLEMLEREVKRLESLHDVLFEKIATVDLRQLQAPIQVTVVQEPLPDEIADTPQVRMIVVASLMGGLLLGGVIAYVQDVLDDRFASPEEMSAQLHVPMLAFVQRLDPLEGEGLATVHAFAIPHAVETEAFRTLRTALTLSAGVTERIAISSAEPSDGKTTVAANLAVFFAKAGKRTLVIDADLRKPGMTALMGLKGQPGVSDVLCAADNPAQITSRWICHTLQPGLDVLPAGLRRPNPAELLGGSAFVELLAWAESCYDQILIDCPPVLAVSDAQIVGRLVDGAILVVQPHKNHRRLVARACDSFLATGTTVLGVVANGLTAEAGRGYGYGYGYGYGHSDEPEASTSETPTSQASNDSPQQPPISPPQLRIHPGDDQEVCEDEDASKPTPIPEPRVQQAA